MCWHCDMAGKLEDRAAVTTDEAEADALPDEDPLRPDGRAAPPRTGETIMKIISQLLAGAAVLGAVLTGAAAGQAPASASAVPVIYNYASGWHSPAVRPQWVLIGQGGAPAAHTWHWNTWNTRTATSTGTLWVNNCAPSCAQGKPGYHKLYITMYWVKWHNGRPYFYGMKWYTPGWTRLGLLFGKSQASTVWLHFGLQGGTVPGWH